jgi:hypothetical protein
VNNFRGGANLEKNQGKNIMILLSKVGFKLDEKGENQNTVKLLLLL